MPKKRRGIFKELIHRLTGFSTPFLGVSWKPLEPEREVIRRLLNFLEDRRVLFNPYTLEVEGQVVESVTEIRQRLTRVLDELPEGSHAVPGVKAMRAACRRFLDEPHPEAPHLGAGMDMGKFIRTVFVVPRLPDGKETPGPDRADEEQEPVGIVDETDHEDAGTDRRWGHPHGNGFLIALGELRATFGTHLAFLAAQYGIDVEGDLASVLPAADED